MKALEHDQNPFKTMLFTGIFIPMLRYCTPLGKFPRFLESGSTVTIGRVRNDLHG
jgi:hypothetical protein